MRYKHKSKSFDEIRETLKDTDLYFLIEEIEWDKKQLSLMYDKNYNLTEKIVDMVCENEWVSVKERLPDEKGHYLVTSALNYYHGGCWDETEKGTSRSLAIAYYDGTDKIGGKNYWNHSHVIAWKLLPDIYRGELK